jgi:two-component sensor histidine kinase
MNALKHAFPTEKPDAAIVIAETDWKLTISDNGAGMPDLNASGKKGGLGTSLVQSLAKRPSGYRKRCPRNGSFYYSRHIQIQTA